MKTAASRIIPFLAVNLAMTGAAAAQQRIQLPAQDKPLTGTPTTVFSVGKVDGESWEVLSGVRSAAFDARDNLYVLDANNFRVLVFDAAGKFVRVISRKGEGPGELMIPAALVVSPDGTIVVADVGRRAFSLFGSDGRFLRNVGFPEGRGMGLLQSTLYAHPRSGVVAQLFIPPERQANGVTGVRRAPVDWVDFPFTASGAAAAPRVTSLHEFRLPSITPSQRVENGRVTGISTMAPNWEPPFAFGVLADGGLAVVREAAYRVEIRNPAGAVVRVIERPIQPRRGTEADKERYIEARTASMPTTLLSRTGNTDGTPDPARIADGVRNAAWMEVIPVLRGVSTDPSGRIWVARTPASFGPKGAIDILRTDGTYVGTVADFTMPASVSGSGRAAFIERDDLGVEQVVVKALPASWR
jgi:hypothetical protein